jgi:hypothetical protein
MLEPSRLLSYLAQSLLSAGILLAAARAGGVEPFANAAAAQIPPAGTSAEGWNDPGAILPPAGPRGPAPSTARHDLSSQALKLASRRGLEHVTYGFDLAGRSAFFSARSEFVKALQLIAQARDSEDGGQAHRQAIEAGLKALQESDDFAPLVGRGDTKSNFAPLIATHRTPVLKDADADRLTPEAALQEYYRFATEQLAWATRGDPAASGALYGLGRVELASAVRAGMKKTMSEPKATALYQAALRVDPQNYQVANELAVLLARYGQLSDAKVLLERSLSVSPQPETWHNLSVVCQNLGEPGAAAQARAQYEALAARSGQPAASTEAEGAPIRWVAPAAFAGAPDDSTVADAQAKPTQPKVPQPVAKAAPPQESPLGQIFSWRRSK